MTEPTTKLSYGDLQAVLNGLPPNLRGQAYLDFLGRLEAAGLR